MKILIIGGTRFLGYHITKGLMERGHEITLFNRGKTPDDFGDRVQRIRGNRYDYENFYKTLKEEKFDAVVDTISFKAQDSQSAVRTFLGNVGHYLHISTAAVYVVIKNYPCPLKEEDFEGELYPQPRGGDGLWSYGYHKRQCEEVLRKAWQKHQFPVTMFRFPIIIGERDYTLRAYSYFLRILDGRPLILPDGGLNIFTHLYQGDIVRTICSNLQNPTSWGNSYNLAQEEYLTLRLFVLKAAEILNKKVELVDIPSGILERSGLGLSFSPFSMRRPFVLDVQKAKGDLGFSSTPYSHWMAKTVHWFVEEYKGDPPENYQLREKEQEFAGRYQKAVASII
ncbi:MAG: NAD-dependent epimerase/dehydratase family protein [Candidatus Aminicenantes bacterium]